jgi:soluble lytic murein transglycosylase-like protein
MRYRLVTMLLCTLLTMLPRTARPFCFEEAGSAYRLPPRLLQGIARVESDMNPAALHRNRDGSTDLGLMQVNSAWIGPDGLDRARLLLDPCYNIRAGASILRDCVNRHGYSWEAVGCYNAASDHKRRIYAWKIFRQLVAGTGTAPPPASPPAAESAVPTGSGSLTVSFEEDSTENAWPPQRGSGELHGD